MNLEVQLSNGETKLMRTLIDTGAEANLIRTGFVPHHITFAARKVLNLIAANGQKIEGGTRTTEITMHFGKEVNGYKTVTPLELTSEFWEASIDVDAIFSFPWI